MTEPITRARQWLARSGAPALVATRPGTVAWLTGGVNLPIDRTSGTDLVWVVVTPTHAFIVTTDVEIERIRVELKPSLDLVAVPWYDRNDALPRVATGDLDPALIASDGHPAFGVDATDDLTALRLPMSPKEQDALRELGADATAALENALRAWKPGDLDWDVAAAISAGVEKVGADAVVLLVGGDDRLSAYRHPVPIGAPMQNVVMGVLAARRGGLYVALTRYAGDVPDLSSVKRIEARILSTCRTGNTYGDVVRAMDAAYTAEGHPNGWQKHHQGAAIGYGSREFDLVPTQTESRWYRQPIEIGHAVAYNPSLPGGRKVEDTYLVTEHGLECVTR